MRTYLITYDTAAPSRHSIASAIMQLGEAWARPLDATWYVQSTERPGSLEQRLRACWRATTGSSSSKWRKRPCC